jgi:GNAT superfamily N-acetyltransferase
VGAFEQALSFINRTTELAADHVQAIDQGIVVRSPSLPEVWSGNQLVLTEPLSLPEIRALADEHLSALPYRQVQILDQGAGAQLEQPFRAAGWRLERDVVMALRRGPDRIVDTGIVVEVDEDQTLELMRRWYLEGPPEIAADGMRQVIEYARREGRLRGDRRFGVMADAGGLAAMTKLRSDGQITQLEDVYTVPEARGRGYARALLTHAIACAREQPHELIFIVADDNGWPKHLYNRLGFEAVGHTWVVHLDPREPLRSPAGRG